MIPRATPPIGKEKQVPTKESQISACITAVFEILLSMAFNCTQCNSPTLRHFEFYQIFNFQVNIFLCYLPASGQCLKS